MTDISKESYIEVLNDTWGTKKTHKRPSDVPEVTEVLVCDPGTALRKVHKQTKLTRKKKLDFLRLMAKDFNVSGNAAKIGVHRNAINYLIKNDEQFNEALNEVKDAWLDKSEESGFKVAVQPTREGYNDRKLFLTAHRPQTYSTKPDIQINQQINIDQASHIESILSRLIPNDDA